MSRRIVIGIDPGADGAVSAIDIDGRQVLGVALARKWAPYVEHEGEAGRMSADLDWASVAGEMILALGVRKGDEVEVVCEAPQLRPGQAGGAAQGFRAGALASAVVAAAWGASGCSVCVEVVAAATWTKEMSLQGNKADRATRKAARVARVLELCPAARPMLVPSGCRVEHDGAADAILIGLYGAGLGRRT
jgi:hypothetical protein